MPFNPHQTINMPRTSTAPVPAVIDIDAVAVSQLSTSANALMLMSQEQDTLVRATAKKLGYQLPADATNPDLIQRDIAANWRRSLEACLEVGRGLAVLKAACPHGQFLPRLEALGIDDGVARKFIHAATKFANRSTSTDLVKAIGNQSKLFEMLVLDDEQIDELAELGQTGELTLDDVATMSVKELRAKLREERAERQAGERVREDLSKKLTKLQVESHKKVAADTDWPDALVPLTDQVAAAGRKIAQGLSELETCRITLFAIEAELQGDEQARFDAALAHVADVYQEALRRGENKLQQERLDFDRSLGNMAGSAK